MPARSPLEAYLQQHRPLTALEPASLELTSASLQTFDIWRERKSA